MAKKWVIDKPKYKLGQPKLRKSYREEDKWVWTQDYFVYRNGNWTEGYKQSKLYKTKADAMKHKPKR